MRKRIFRPGFITASAEEISTKVTTASMKALPVLVLLATSAVNPIPVAAQQCSQLAASQPRESIDRELINPVSNGTYTVVHSTQTPQTPQKKTSKEVLYLSKVIDDNEYIGIHGFSTDGIDTTAEKMYVHYRNIAKNKIHIVKAKIFGYCPEPREDGKFLAVIGIVGDTELDAYAFPAEFKSIFDRSVMSEARNNNAVKVLSKAQMIQLSGEEYFENAPDISILVPSEQQQTDRAGGTASY